MKFDNEDIPARLEEAAREVRKEMEELKRRRVNRVELVECPICHFLHPIDGDGFCHYCDD